jgi:hypothetical protein
MRMRPLGIRLEQIVLILENPSRIRLWSKDVKLVYKKIAFHTPSDQSSARLQTLRFGMCIKRYSRRIAFQLKHSETENIKMALL